jgi:hypothetical protein
MQSVYILPKSNVDEKEPPWFLCGEQVGQSGMAGRYLYGLFISLTHYGAALKGCVNAGRRHLELRIKSSAFIPVRRQNTGKYPPLAAAVPLRQSLADRCDAC